MNYNIEASNCGECPNTTISNMVTCSGDYTQLLNDRQCSFAVQTVVCDGIAGDISTAVKVTMTGSDSGIGSTRNKTSMKSVTTCVQGLCAWI